MSKFNDAASTVREVMVRLQDMFNKKVGTDNLTDKSVTTEILNDDSVTKIKINADVVGNGLEQNVNGSIQLKDDGAIYANLPMAIYNMIYEVGHIMTHPWQNLPAYGSWLWLDGRSIGDASSNATARANADCFNLFQKLWIDYSNTTAPIYTDAGVLSTRLTSAEADWALHKKILLAPQGRGRVFLSMDDYGEGGTPANNVTDPNADILGANGGAETHALTAGENGTHSHVYPPRGSTPTTPSGTRPPCGGSDTGAYSAPVTSSSGLGTAHNNLQPWVAVKYIIRY